MTVPADRRGASVPVLLSALCCVAYLAWTPAVPDLSAQVARANMARSAGLTSWVTGWFGGIDPASYSVLSPAFMATLGVRVTGVSAAVLAAVATTILTRCAVRPRLGATAYTVMILANLLDGRVTFAVGVACGTWALVALQRNKLVLGVALAVATYLATPLAGLFLAIVAVAVAIVDARRRRDAAAMAGVLLLTAAVMLVYFPNPGTMPNDAVHAIVPALFAVAVAVVCPNAVIRWTAAGLLTAMVLFLFVPTAVGSNITRLVWICAVPVVVAYGQLPRKLLVALVAVLAVWPAADLVGQIERSHTDAAHWDFYRPLVARLNRLATADPVTLGQRVEVVDPANHWASAYLSSTSLARGWDRQADHAANPLFYQNGPLSPSAYHAWLRNMAVGWVALPDTELDYAARAEGDLVRAGAPFLRPIWTSATWRLYRVTDPKPLVAGARVVAVTGHSFTLSASTAGIIHARIRWSPYLRTVEAATAEPVPSCLRPTGGWLDIYVPHAETFVLTSGFDARAPFAEPDQDCVQDLRPPVIPLRAPEPDLVR